MRIGETYRITAVRLVEFHNLGTTTVELPAGGHLFLLGDNGSGKTTLLDAVHLVLTAGWEMELNSAARVAGAKDSGGRTIQGIVLRYNAVTGRTAREAGITYAAVELKSDTGKTFSLAVGLSAEGMDVRHEKWGGIASVPVGELPLTVEVEGKLRVATQAEFKQGIAPLRGGRYFSHIGDYAAAVGERFFGGKEKFSDVCKLLRTGKAYREIAAKASNYDELFRQLLEGPSRETFEPLLKGLRELEESKGKLDNIELRSEYLKGLKRESERLGRARLIGTKARAEEQARREKAAEARLAEAEKAVREAAKALSESEKALERIKELEGKIEAVQSECGAMLFGLQRDFDATARAEETCARESESANEKARDAAEAKEELDDLRILMKESGIDGQLAQRIESAKRAVERAEKRKNALAEETGAVGGRLRSLEGGFDAKRLEAEGQREALAACEAQFKGEVPEGGTAEDYVRSVLPKCLEADADLQEMHEKVVADARVAESEIARRVRDARGEAYSFSFDRERNLLKDRRGGTIDEVLADETGRLEELRGMINTKSREIFERIFMGEVMKRLYLDLLQLEDLARRIRTKLAGRQFGTNRYAFDIAPVAEYEGLVELVRNYSRLDSAGGKDELREYMELHRDAIMESDIDAVPDVFDYRKWFRFELKVLTENEDGRVIDRKLKSMGSGGEQAVPNYLLILAVAEFLYHAGDNSAAPKLAPLLFDEAFYGIDAARRDQLLALADDLGLQLFVSSPDQDGVKREIKNSVSLIVVKDENLDVHLSPVIWRNEAVQGDLLGGAEEKPGMTVEWGDESAVPR